MSKFLARLGAGSLLAAAASAQIVTPGRILGFASDATATVQPAILRQTLCAPGARICPSPLPAPAAAYAGGAAYNAMNRSVWHTQGTRMAETDIDTCQLLCSAPANLVLGSNSLATGLEVCESRYQLLQLESVPGAAALTVWHIRSCPMAVLSTCRFPLPSNQHVAGGVALDERHGLVLYATSVFGAVLPANQILIARDGDPCNIVCNFGVTGCGTVARLGPITGLAYDNCDQLLYVSDGTQVAIFTNRVGTTPCDFRDVACCPISPNVTNYRWHGIDVEPRHPTAVGVNCLDRRCPDCNTMEMLAVGDSAVGNPRFRIDLINAPTGGFFQLGIAGGRCRPTGFPIFCGNWHTELSTLVLLPIVPIAGSTRCDGSAIVGLPVPKEYSLCGAALCAQGIVLCPPLALPPTLGLTNALELFLD